MKNAVGFTQTMGIADLRRELPAIARTMSEGSADIIPFGSHRRPIAAVVPLPVLLELLELAELDDIARSVRRFQTTDTGERVALDDVIAALGFTDEELEETRTIAS